MASNGSIQNINEIPEDIKALYKTAWEISQKVVIDQAADRGRAGAEPPPDHPERRQRRHQSPDRPHPPHRQFITTSMSG